MKHIHTSTTVVEKIKRRAKETRSQFSSLGSARDAAAREVGYDSFHHVTECLKTSTSGSADIFNPVSVAQALIAVVNAFLKEPSSSTYAQAADFIKVVYFERVADAQIADRLRLTRHFLNEMLFWVPEVLKTLQHLLAANIDFPLIHEEHGKSGQSIVFRLECDEEDLAGARIADRSISALSAAVREVVPEATFTLDPLAFGQPVSDDDELQLTWLLYELHKRGHSLRAGRQASGAAPAFAEAQTCCFVLGNLESQHLTHDELLDRVRKLNDELLSFEQGFEVFYSTSAGSAAGSILEVMLPSQALSWTFLEDRESLAVMLDHFRSASPALIGTVKDRRFFGGLKCALGLTQPGLPLLIDGPCDADASPVEAYMALSCVFPDLKLVNDSPKPSWVQEYLSEIPLDSRYTCENLRHRLR